MFNPVPAGNVVHPTALPYDLRLWETERALVQLVFSVTGSTAAAHFDNRLNYGPHKNIRPHVLLSLVLYCYAMGLFSSRGIVQQSRGDAPLCYLLVQSDIDQTSLRKFRRRWRQLIQQCLVRLFRLVWVRRYAGESPETSLELMDQADSVKAGISTAILKMFICEAEARILRAIFCDAMEDDE